MTEQEEVAHRTLQHADYLLYWRGRHLQGEDFETFRAARMLIWQAANRVLTGDEPEAVEPYDLDEGLLAAMNAIGIAFDTAPKRVRRATIQWLIDKYLPGAFVRQE